MGTSAAVLGASGYAGGELLRLLAAHPVLTPVAASGSRRSGDSVAAVHPHLSGLIDLRLADLADAAASADVCFSCLPHGVLPAELGAVRADVVVDLADDHRADDDWLYGLPEMNGGAASARIANPGCYPTASLLCLVPFASAGWIEGPVVIDALSGYSGAGRSGDDHLSLASADASVTAYGSVEHRHIAEIERGLKTFGGGMTIVVSFTPHLVPMARGLLVTARAPLAVTASDEEALGLLRDRYATSSFVEVVESWPATKPVVGTNRAHLSARIDPRSGHLICSAAIDNLGKGAAGQAIQNANLALGLDETVGLEGVASWP